MSKNVQHVINSSSGKWVLVDSSSRKSEKYFRTQKQAKEYGIKECKTHKSDLVIHRKDGSIVDRRSYSISVSKSNEPKR